MRLTKIDVAEAHLVTAIRSTFRNEHPASIYLLASSAREMLTQIGHRLAIRTVLHGIAEETGARLGRLIEETHRHANFMKHADKDPAAVLDFNPALADQVLFIASVDFARIAKGQPIELQVFEAWYMATIYETVLNAPLRQQRLVRAAIQHFPGIRRANRVEQGAIGLAAIEQAKDDPRFAMEINRDVILLEDTEGK